MSTKCQQYNSQYLLQLLNITFQYKSEFQFLSFELDTEPIILGQYFNDFKNSEQLNVFYLLLQRNHIYSNKV
jgi:hypothetical protein